MAKRTSIHRGVESHIARGAFNLFNRVQFGPPNAGDHSRGAAAFGQVTTQVNRP